MKSKYFQPGELRKLDRGEVGCVESEMIFPSVPLLAFLGVVFPWQL